MTLLFSPFALFFPGYFFLKSIWGKNEKLSFWEGMILSVALSFIISYPAGLTNNIIESIVSPNPFQVHIDSLYPIYLIICAGLWAFSRKKNSFHERYKQTDKKYFFAILSIFLLAVFMRLYGSELQNINQDEQELSLYSYHLVDGILVGRQAFFLSSTVHSPLGFYFSFIIYQLLEPYGAFGIHELILRSPMFVFGILELCVFLLFAARMKFSKALTLAGLALLAVNSYAIFGSRLMIPQDCSIFSFYILLFSYFFLKVLEKNTKPARLNIFLLGLLFATIFLIKLAAIFMLPLVFIFWFAKKKSTMDFLKVALVSLFFFSPVIIFNFISYTLTGYTDVPTAKLLNFFGIQADSIMNNMDLYGAVFPPFFNTMLGFLEMLADQLSLIFVLAAVSAIFILTSKYGKIKKDTALLFFLLIFLVSIIFFSLNGYRAYYAEYLTIPLLLIGMSGFEHLNKKIAVIFFIPIFLYSAYYSYNTHIIVTPRPDNITLGEYGRFGPYSWEEFNTHRSLASWSFLRDDGFPALKEYLKDKKDLIVIEDSFLAAYLHHFRYYLGIHRDVTAHYLAELYKDERPFEEFSDYDYSQDAIGIFEYFADRVLETDTVLLNHNDKPKIIIRELKKK